MNNKLLIWNLAGIVYKEKAVNFLKRFENSLCVFSGAVSQLYTNYNIWPITADNSKVLVLPNPHAHHDIFQSIGNMAIEKTGLFIIPGEAIGNKGLYLGKKNKGCEKFHFMPLQKGLNKIAQQMPNNESFLPIITNKDLREINRCNPILHLHRLKIDQLPEISDFEIHTIRNTIEDKMDKHLMCA